MHEGGGDCIKYLKRGWNKRGEGNKDFKKGVQAGSTGGCFKRRGAGTPLQTMVFKKTSKFEWILDNIRIEKIIWPKFGPQNFVLDVLTLLDVRHCLKLQSCEILRKTNEPHLRKQQKTDFQPDFGLFRPILVPQFFFHGLYLY